MQEQQNPSYNPDQGQQQQQPQQGYGQPAYGKLYKYTSFIQMLLVCLNN